jgi:hypothetical protein
VTSSPNYRSQRSPRQLAAFVASLVALAAPSPPAVAQPAVLPAEGNAYRSTAAVGHVGKLAAGIRKGEFPPRRESARCTACDFRRVCCHRPPACDD